MNMPRYGARTEDELVNREVKATKVGAWSTSLTAQYLTDPDLVAAVLPKPLEPTDEPIVKVSIATVDLGGRFPPFGAGTFGVAARHDGLEGFYPLFMPMTTEQAVVGGRETFGEPKKLAEVELTRDGDRVTGSVTRMGVTIIEITGRVTAELAPPPDIERTDFYFKFLPAPHGTGFDADPSLVYCKRAETNRKLESIDGGVVLTDSRFDPVADLAVKELTEITLSERQSSQSGQIITTVPAEWLRPFVHQRYDDLSPTGSK
jgi:acetoacetate decarboxylase